MTLSIKERLLLLSILPKEGDILTLRIVQNLRAALSFSEEEHARLGLTNTDGLVKWDSQAPQESEVEVGPKAHVLIQDTLKDLNKTKKLTEDFISLWDKFSPES